VIAELAVATHTHPGPWWDEPEEMLLTVLAVLEEKAQAQADAAKKRR